MSEVMFRFQKLLPITEEDDEYALFAKHYPTEASWLRVNGGAWRVSIYRWSEFVARYVCDHQGMTVFEFDLWLDQPIAEQFGNTFNMRGARDA